MKNKILLLSLALSAPVLADYKITFQNHSLQLKPFESSEPEVWVPPVGVMSLNPNNVTVHCLDVPSNASIADRTLGVTVYEVVRTKADAKTYAATACTSNMTDMSSMFQYSVFNQDIGSWDVSNVTDMNSMFRNSVFNQDIGSWDVSNVTDMYGMFRATAFNKPIENWDVSNVTNMFGMFYQASTFNQDIGNWDVSNVADMRYMFYQDSAFNQNLSGWCVSDIASKPSSFDTGASLWTEVKPVWGTCP